jgi:6-pyruvoyl-tetrahydropterin synthase
VSSGFSIYVAKENLKFSAAHFIAYPGFREPLHGHNYQVGVRVEGRLSSTGYVLDFGLIKRLTKQIVDRLDERTLVPAESDCLQIEHLDTSGQWATPDLLRNRRIPAARKRCLSFADRTQLGGGAGALHLEGTV